MSPRRQADSAIEPFGMPRQQILVDSRLVVEALEKSGRDQLQQVAISLLVLAQQHQMVVAIRIAAAGEALLRDVHFAADHRMHALGFGAVVKLHRAEKISVIGHRHGGHLLLDDEIHQLTDLAGAVEQRIIGMAMQMDERRRRTHLLSRSGGRATSILLGDGRSRMGRDLDFARIFASASQPEFDPLFGHQLRESFAPFDQDYGGPIENLVQAESGHLRGGVQPVEIDVVDARTIFVNQREGRAGNLVGFGARLSPFTMPLARVVFPAPRLPISSTNAWAGNSAASASPNAMVSSSDCV